MRDRLAGLAAALLRSLHRSLRIARVGGGALAGLRREGRPILYALWHGSAVVPLLGHADQGVVVLVSLSADGDLAAGILRRLGYVTVRGSSSRGGREAFHELASRLVPGAEVAIVPDGPRGPARVLKPGLLRLAARTGAAIVPVGAAAWPARRLASWDALLLPAPFARAAIAYGEPFEVAGPLDPEAEAGLGQRLSAALDALATTAASALDGPGQAPAAGIVRSGP